MSYLDSTPDLAPDAGRGHRGRRRHHPDFPGPEGHPGFGPGHHHGPHRGGPRGRARRGDVRNVALGLLAEQPMHGYQLIQEISARSGQRWRPSAGAVYPALAQLEDEGLVRAVEQDGRRVFHLTEAGQAYVAERGDAITAPWQDLTDGSGDARRDLMGQVRQLGMAAVQVAKAGTDDQAQRAVALMSETRKALYRILAEDATEQ